MDGTAGNGTEGKHSQSSHKTEKLGSHNETTFPDEFSQFNFTCFYPYLSVLSKVPNHTLDRVH